MAMEIRSLPAHDVDAGWHVVERAFGTVPHPADADVELALVDPTHFYGTYDDDRLVGTGGSFEFAMSIPGATVPVAGVTWVGVLPTHRRRGALTTLMARQLADLHAQGRAVAALWASQSAIYGRFGYGPAAWDLSVTVPRGAPFRTSAPPGAVSLVDPDAAVLRPLFDEVQARTPGCPARDDAWWAYRLHDPEHRREGAGPLQCVVTDGGYALYATAPAWDMSQPAGVVRVKEVVAATAGARARLWRFLLDLDLMREVTYHRLAVDDPLLLDLMVEPGTARAVLRNSLHVRLVDVPAALASRRYASPVDVLISVEDQQCPWNSGTWHLSGDRSGATCEPSRSAPDLALSVADLGAAYLGGTPLRSRGVDERRPGVLALTSTAFGPLDSAPWCPMVF